jgi:hypothetical protein
MKCIICGETERWLPSLIPIMDISLEGNRVLVTGAN